MFNFDSDPNLYLNFSINFHSNLYLNFHLHHIFIPNLNHYHLKVHLILHNLEEGYHILYHFTR